MDEDSYYAYIAPLADEEILSYYHELTERNQHKVRFILRDTLEQQRRKAATEKFYYNVRRKDK